MTAILFVNSLGVKILIASVCKYICFDLSWILAGLSVIFSTNFISKGRVSEMHM